MIKFISTRHFTTTKNGAVPPSNFQTHAIGDARLHLLSSKLPVQYYKNENAYERGSSAMKIGIHGNFP